MNDDHYYSISDPLYARRDLLQAHLWTLELQQKQDVLDGISTKKSTQFKRLETQMSSLKKNLVQLKNMLPSIPEPVIHEEKKHAIRHVRKEIFPTAEPDMSELEKEIADLKKKIDGL